MFLMYPKPARPQGPPKVSGQLAGKVRERDRGELAKAGQDPAILCLAPFLDGAESGRCSGRETMQHVKMELGLSVRRIHIPEMLLTLCEFHHLETKAGANWATNELNLIKQRRYLAGLYPDFWRRFMERQMYVPRIHQP
jgi:hypothetical protein